MNVKLLRFQSLLCGLLSFVLLSEWAYSEFMGGRQNKPPLNSEENNAVYQLPTIAAAAPDVTYNEMVERPLFIEGRKPIVEAPVETVQNVELGQIDDWVLIGIYEKDKRPMALFTKKNEAKKYLKISNEQMISGWQLKEIHPDRVILQQATEDKSILLRKPRVDIKPAAPIPGKPGVPGAAGRPPRIPKPPVQPINPNPENANDDNQ